MKSRSNAFFLRLLAGIASAALLTPLAVHAQEAPTGLEKVITTFTGETHVSLDGWIAFAAVGIGAVLALLYLRGIYLVLHYASATYDLNLNPVDDEDYSSKGERRLLYIGSLFLVVLSGLVISSYGWGWLFLYLGPAITLFGPLVIIISMEVDIRKYRRALGEKNTREPLVRTGSTLPVGQEAA
ncbi:MAG: hypothetical protein QM796_05120 [Chthoniobacteraceae bacterium]